MSNASVSARRTLHLGDAGHDVRDFQNDLRALRFIDPSISAKGVFGPLTLGALKDWERAHHRPADGVLSAAEAATPHAEALAARSPHQAHLAHLAHVAHHPAAPAAPGVRAPVHAPASGSGRFPSGTEAQYRYLAALTRAKGGHFRTGANQRNLVAFRTEDSTRANGGRGRYNDTLAMVWRDSAGHHHVKLYTHFNTEPNESMRNGTTLGRVKAGSYDFGVSQRSNGDPCLRPRHGVRVERDRNHDGRFTEHKVEQGGDVFLFHRGGPTNTWSQGCFTFTPGEWSRFWSDIRHAHGAINVTVVNGKPRGLP